MYVSSLGAFRALLAALIVAYCTLSLCCCYEGYAVIAVRKVRAFAAGSGQNYDRRVAVLSECGAVCALDLCPGSLVHAVLGVCHQRVRDRSGSLAAVLFRSGGIPVPEALVDLDAFLCESVLKARSLAGIYRTGTGSAVHQLNASSREEGNLGSACQRKSCVVVLKERCALGFYLCAELALIFPAGVFALEVALKILDVLIKSLDLGE